jgi:hypothetical protein
MKQCATVISLKPFISYLFLLIMACYYGSESAVQEFQFSFSWFVFFL